MTPNKIDAPIPGENFTADTKNYPWHRPPEKADFVEIVDKAIESMNTPQKIGQILTMLESGETILDFVTGTARVTIGNGKIPIDQAVLAAGPIAKFVETVAEEAGIEFERGWDQEPRVMTKARLDALRGVNKKSPKKEPKPDPVKEEKRGGLMGQSNGPTSKDEQMSMLGYGDEEKQ